MMSAAWSRSAGEKPWWFTVLQNLGDDSSESDSDYPSSDSDDIDIEDTSDESESDWSEHSSDDDFIDNSDDQN